MFDVIAFDADDTLWHNESLYIATQEKFKRLLAPYARVDGVEDRLYRTEVGNIPYFGYGIKSFALSMIQAAVEITEGKISSRDLAQIVEFAKAMLDEPVQLLDHVAETIPLLAAQHRLMIITKGDLLDQHRKLDRSGLAAYFDLFEVVNEKDGAIYRAILDRHNIDPRRFVMVGNSVKSDVLPVVELGGRAVFIPYHTTWEHENVPEHLRREADYVELAHMGKLPALLAQWEAEGATTGEE